jgi:3-dehydroquinate synthase
MICDEIHNALAAQVAGYDAEQICVVADDKIALDTDYPTLRMAVSEGGKNLESVSRIWDFLFEHGITRRGVLVCIGGGVLTDLGGFAASTYKRGIDYINVPTTLLAMIDASSGGKTGINYRGLKNSIGTFAPPVATLICPAWLRTLPAPQMLSGFGEMLKTGLIDVHRDKRQGTRDHLWNRLLQYDLEAMPVDALTPLIEACVEVKRRIVETDPKETGLRKVLNFGHTFGHALEEVPGDGSRVTGEMPHGYAVVYGMIAELYLSVTLLGCPKEPLQQLTQLMLHHYGKPQCKCSDMERLVTLMQQDKKNEHSAEINCTLLQAPGEPVINQVITAEQAAEAWEYLFSL